MTRMTRTIGLLCAGGLAWAAVSTALSARPQGPETAGDQGETTQSDDPVPTFRGGINVVRVDVIVQDGDGNPVLDLTADDFEVYEDGERQTLDSFEVIRVEPPSDLVGDVPPRIRSAADEETEAAREDTRLVAIFLDDYHVRRINSMKVRVPLADFIRNELSPYDMVAVMYPLQPVGTLRFTRDHEAVLRTVNQFLGRKYEYEVENEFENRYAHYPRNLIERIRHQVTFTALKSLLTRLGGLTDGRKTLLLVSEGFTAVIPPQMENPLARLTPDQLTIFNQQIDIDMDIRQVTAVANRNNTAIYALDPRGLAVDEFGVDVSGIDLAFDRQILSQTQNTLRMLSEDTDGRAIVNQNTLRQGLEQIVQDSSAYYLLSYRSSEATQDGEFHEIRVRVGRRGVQVRARPGYWALTSEDVERATRAAVDTGPPEDVRRALGTLAVARGGRLVRTAVDTGPGSDGRTRVTFVWEPEERERFGGDEPVRLRLTAAGEDGTPYFRGPVPAESAPDGARVVSFEADPGPLDLLFSVEGTDASVIDRDSQQVEIPDLTSVPVWIGTPQVFRARTAREWRAVEADAAAVPALGRNFSRRERLLIRFGVYGNGASVSSTARLLNREGEAMRDLTVTPSPLGAEVRQIDLPLSGVAAGDYVVELRSGEHRELLAVRVAG